MIKSTKKRDKKVLKALYISVAVTFIVLIIYTALALAHHEDLADEVINRNIIDVPRTNRLTILDMIIFVVAIFILFIGRNSTFLVVLTLIALVICWFLLFATIVVSYQNRELDSKDDFSRRSIQCEEYDTSLFRNGEDYDINKSLCDTSVSFFIKFSLVL